MTSRIPDLGAREVIHVRLWKAIESIILSLHENAAVDTLVIDGAFPRALLSRGWAQSHIVRALRSPLHSLDSRLTTLIRSGRASALIFKPQYPYTTFVEEEQSRIRSLFQALTLYDMLRF